MRTISKVAWTVVGLAIAACSATSDGDTGRDDDDGAATSGAGAAGGGIAGTGATSSAGGGISTSSTGGMDQGCAEASSKAEATVLPADIIIAVDNSGSMNAEAQEVQASMNDFVNAVVASGIDAHVVLISADSTDDNGICVPAPVGSGACPTDESLPAYRHVNQMVASSNAFELIVSTYDQWQASLRPGATKTVAVISDDDSAIDAATFSNDLVTLDPTFQGFKFNAIVSPYDLNPLQCFSCMPPNCGQCDPCCGAQAGFACGPLPADEGKAYKDLVGQTGGVLGNLCIQDFLPVFQDMATAVVSDSQVACVYAIPEPPENLDLNFDEVNVEYRPDPNSAPQTLPFVGSAAECGTGGWYYDDPTSPTQILLCPETCEAVQGASAGIDVTFGCATVVK